MKNLPIQSSNSVDQRLKKSFYNMTTLRGREEEEGVLAGFMYTIENLGFIVNFMKEWVLWKDGVLDRIPEGTKEYADEFSKRGFTYTEFRLITSGSIKEENYKRYRVFQYLYLYDKDDKEFFTIEHSDEDIPQIDRYIQAISKWVELEIPVLKSFFFTTKMPLYFPIKHYKKHAYILSQSGSGKSELIKLMFYDFERLSRHNNSKSLVLIEPHGDLAQEVLMFAFNKKHKERVVYLDPFIRETAISLLGEDILGADYTFVINPFDLKRKTEKEIGYMTGKLSSAFFEIINSDETFQMEAIIEACVETLLRRKDSTIADLKRFMEDEENDDLVEIGKTIPNIERSKLMRNRFKSDGKIRTTKGSIYYRLQKLLGNAQFRRLLVGQSTVDLEKELNSGKIIICNVSKGRLDSAANSFGKLIVALILGYVTKRQDIPKKLRKETFLFIDEFQNYVSPSIEEVMAETRKYALHVTLAHQVMGQNMTADMKRVIAGNTAFKIAGENEPESLAWMAKQMKNMDASKFEKLPEYSFYVNNKFNKKAGTYMFRVPDFLVDVKPPYYMSKADLKELFLYLVHESGYYRKVVPEESTPSAPIRTENTPIQKRTEKSGIYQPDFKE